MAGLGVYDEFGIGPNNNLSSSAYRRLTGPPLAPRRQFSRVISNFMTATFQVVRHGDWVVIGTWKDVVSKTGYHFLHHLFNGDPPQPGPRDLRGVRPNDLAKMKAAVVPWAKLIVRELWKRAIP